MWSSLSLFVESGAKLETKRKLTIESQFNARKCVKMKNDFTVQSKRILCNVSMTTGDVLNKINSGFCHKFANVKTKYEFVRRGKQGKMCELKIGR